MEIKTMLSSYFAKRKNVLSVYLFGSAAQGKENKFSDVDIAVLFDATVSREKYIQGKLSIMDEVSHILDRNIDIVVLNEAG